MKKLWNPWYASCTFTWWYGMALQFHSLLVQIIYKLLYLFEQLYHLSYVFKDLAYY